MAGISTKSDVYRTFICFAQTPNNNNTLYMNKPQTTNDTRTICKIKNANRMSVVNYVKGRFALV